MPTLYLVRHGEAFGDGPDSERALTDRGIADVERVAAWAARANVSVRSIHHSGKRRAEQTAAIFAAHLRPPAGVSPMSGLHPNDDPAALVVPDLPAMIVSHLPFLAHLTAALTGTAVPNVAFRPSTLVALTRMEEGFVIECVVHPGVV